VIRDAPAARVPAVFLDRDGTLIEDVGYLRVPEEVSLFPWTVDAVRALNRAGFPVVVITNQSGIARGLLTETMLDVVHRHLSSLLEAGGARVDAYYYCPHHPTGSVAEYVRRCECRKPGRELIDRAAADFNIDPSRSFVVGDKWLDVGAARAVGARGLLVRTGYGAGQEAEPQGGLSADAIVDNLAEAASWILRQC
jgi:D-glycero-D-manno-heptose 1,7-bisphosphate phosphatase